MPYTIRKQKCKQSDGDSGSYKLSYTDKKGKKHSACHTSKKKAKGQIAAIEMEADTHDQDDSENVLREYIRLSVDRNNKRVYESKLPDEIYGNLENAIIKSQFWTYPNSEEDIDVNSISGEWHSQTEAGEILSSTIEDSLSGIGIPVSVAVISVESDSNPKFKLPMGKDHMLYPNKLVVGGEQAITSKGRFIMYLYLVPVDKSFNSLDVNPEEVARIISNIVRHETIHLTQMEKRRKGQKISRLTAKDRFEAEGEIPAPGSKREDYLGSKIEIDAYAHEFAEDLLQRFGKDGALDIIRGARSLDDLELSDQFKEYFKTFENKKLTNRLKKKMYLNIIDLAERGIY